SYVFPHVWHPGSAGKYARYPSSWCSISSVYVSAFFSTDSQYTIIPFQAHRRKSSMNLRWVAITLPLAMPAPADAFDDKQFCAAVQQVALAAEKDIGAWIDRITRNAGMRIVCDRKLVEFIRFTYAASASMTAD